MNGKAFRAAFLIIVFFFVACQKAGETDIFKDLPLTDLSGKAARLSCPPSRLLIVNLWATWCAPCKKEIVHLVELREEFRTAGCDIVGISLDSVKPEKLKPEVTARGITYPVYAGDASRILSSLGVPAVPATIIIDARGAILKKLPGYHEKEELRAAVLEAVRTKTSIMNDKG